MSNNLLDVIKEVFSTYSYSVSASNQGYDLVAKKANNSVAIKVADDVSEEDLDTFAQSIKGNGTRGLIVSMAVIQDDVKSAAAKQDIAVWDRPELEKQIGKAVLLGVEARNDPLVKTELEVPATAEAVPEAQAPEAEQKPAKKDISALTQELYGTGSAKTKAKAASAKAAPKPEVIEVEEPEVIEAAPEPEVEEEEGPATIPLHTVPYKIKKADALKISGNIGRAEDVECSLKFIPFWKYDYSLDVMSRYKDITVPLTGKGSKMINSINKNVSPAPGLKPIENIELPDAPYNIEMAILTQEEAYAMAMKSLIDEHSKTIRFKATIGEAAMVEHKKFSPKPAEINMRMELIYIPFWAVRSHKGYMEINAIDGKPTQMPIDDGAEIL